MGCGMPERVEIEESESTYDGYLQVTTWRLRHETWAGGMSPTVRREVVERGATAAVLPYDPARDEVLLIEQFRPGVFATPSLRAAGDTASAWLMEIVAGVVDEGETPEAVARREAMEEANLAISDLAPVAGLWLTPGICTEFCHIYCGRADLAGAGGVFGHDEEDEDIRSAVYSMEALTGMLAAGRLQNAITVVAVQWLLLNRERLRATWT